MLKNYKEASDAKLVRGGFAIQRTDQTIEAAAMANQPSTPGPAPRASPAPLPPPPPPPQPAAQPQPPSPPQPKPPSPSRSRSATHRQMPIGRAPRTPSPVPSPSQSPSRRSSRKQPAAQALPQKPSSPPPSRSPSKPSPPPKRPTPPSPSLEAFRLQQAAAIQEVSQAPSLSAASVLQPDSPAKTPVEPSPQESRPTTEALSQTTMQSQPELSTRPQAQEQSQSEPASQPAEAGNQTTQDSEPKTASVDTVLNRTPTLSHEPEREPEETEEENSTIDIEFMQELPLVEDKEPSQLLPAEEKPQMDEELKQELSSVEEKHQIHTESVEDKEPSQLPPVEEKPQMDKELKQDKELKHQIDTESVKDREPSQRPPAEEKPQMDKELKNSIQTSRHPQVEGKSTIEPELMQDTQPSQIPEEGKPKEIIEEKQNAELEVQTKMEIRSPKTDIVREGNEDDEPKPKLEIQLAEKSSTLSSNEPKNRMEIMSAMAGADSQTTRQDLAKSELPGRQTNLNGSQGRESTMGLESIPLASPSPGEQASFHKEIKKDSSKLVQKLNIGRSQQLGSERTKSIITLAGENKGATMFMGHETANKEGVHTHRGHRLDKNTAEASSGDKEIQKQMLNHTSNKDPVITASINSNVQSINNSLLHKSSCSVGDPGIHLVRSTKTNRPVKLKEKSELTETFRSAVSTAPAQKLTYEPNIRCLRGLLMESSDRDQKNLQKPQHQGCHYSCEDKREGKAEQDSTSTIDSNTKHSEEGITGA